MDTLPVVWIVVLTWGQGLADTLRCLGSLAKVAYPRLSLLVVDNASEPNPREQLHKAFPGCHIVRNRCNLGYAGGNNVGIRYSLARGADWVMILNNDTEVSPRLVHRLVAAAFAHPRFRILGPVINSLEQPDAVLTDGCLFHSTGKPSFFERKVVPVRVTDPPQVDEVDIVNGCCMMIHASVIEGIGLFDERFYLYHEEADFCLRSREAGFACGVVSEVLVWHKGLPGKRNTNQPTKRYYDARNLLRLLLKHRSAVFERSSTRSCLKAYLTYIYYRFSIEIEQGYCEASEAVLQGFCDAIQGLHGPRRNRCRPLLSMVRAFFRVAPVLLRSLRKG